MEFVEQEKVRKNTYQPCEVMEGVVLSMERTIASGKTRISAVARMGDKEVGNASLSTDTNRIFISVFPLDAMGREKGMELAGTMADALKRMLTEE